MVWWAALASVIVSAAALFGSAAILVLGDRAERAAVWGLAFAIGTLLGAAALHLLPEALEAHPADEVMMLFLAGIVVFIVFERAIRWRHSHLRDDSHHQDVTAEILLWGDAFHNLLDGLILGVTFNVSLELGLMATVAVFAHEVPQEIGDFAVLLASGMARRRALILNYLSALTVVPGAIVAALWSSSVHAAVGWLLPVAAGGFVYIALADLVPSLHHRRGRWAGVIQILLIVSGVAVIYAMGKNLHHG